MTNVAVTKFVKDDTVWIPTAKLPGTHAFAMAERKVLGQKDAGRSILVEDGAGTGGTIAISTRLVHPAPLAILLLRIGDMQTEVTLLDPLAKSVLQFLRLLLPDDALTTLHVRTESEIDIFMRTAGAAFSHVILVGHGRSDAVKLPDGGWLPVEDFLRLLRLGGNVRSVISLACSTGLTTFGRTLTDGTPIADLAAPSSEVHGATASLFAQQLLTEHLLEGKGFPTAVRRANDAVGGTTFVHWRSGVKNGIKKPGRKR